MAASTDNYWIGKAIIYLADVSGQPSWEDVGNCPSASFELQIEKLDHFSSRTGVRSKDRTIVLSKGGTLTITTDEITKDNIKMFVLGEDDSDGKIRIFAGNAITKMVKIVGTNEVGRKFEWIFNKVDFIPSGSFNFISDEWGTIEMTAEVLTDDTGEFGTIEDLDEEEVSA